MNAQKDDRRISISDTQVMDEGWWDSLLADEQKIIPSAGHKTGSGKISEMNPDPDLQHESVDWEAARKAFTEDLIVIMQVTGYNGGGLLVNNKELSGFVPVSHLIEPPAGDTATNLGQDLASYKGKDLKLKLIECSPENERIILSERAALSEPGCRVELFDRLEPGMKVRGKVTNVTNFGVFLDLGGAEGLIHLSELSWGRVSSPRDLVKVGEELEVIILEIASEKCRVGLSRKRLLPNPWEKSEHDYPPGRIVEASVTSVVSYGAFAVLDSGIEGLIHVSEMSLSYGQTPRDILSVGDVVQVRVLNLEARRQRLGFSMKINS